MDNDSQQAYAFEEVNGGTSDLVEETVDFEKKASSTVRQTPAYKRLRLSSSKTVDIANTPFGSHAPADAVDLFMQSLAVTIKQFPPRQIIEAKTKLMEVVSNIQLDIIDRQSYDDDDEIVEEKPKRKNKKGKI